jgi:hypothetical protein
LTHWNRWRTRLVGGRRRGEWWVKWVFEARSGEIPMQDAFTLH